VKIKLDENMARAHKRYLQAQGHDVHDVHDENASGVSDAELWKLATSEGRFFITLDQDFSDVRRYRPGSHAGILLIRTPRPGVEVVLSILRRVAKDGLEELAGSLSVADAGRTRVRRTGRKR
jgi:predicted nuclease of predicted toxin-antitoxin system